MAVHPYSAIAEYNLCQEPSHSPEQSIMPDGKICYIEIPATDVNAAAKFYADVFAWKSRTRGDGSRAFDDTTGAVSGTWVLGRKPQRESTMLTYIMVDSIDATLKKIAKAGGRVATPNTPLGAAGPAERPVDGRGHLPTVAMFHGDLCRTNADVSKEPPAALQRSCFVVPVLATDDP